MPEIEALLAGSETYSSNAAGAFASRSAWRGEGPQLVIRYGQADGTFSAESFILQVTPNVVLAGDFNGDGHTDLLLLSENSSAAGSYQVLLNDGTAHFSSAGTGVLPSGIFIPAAVGEEYSGALARDGQIFWNTFFPGIGPRVRGMPATG